MRPTVHFQITSSYMRRITEIFHNQKWLIQRLTQLFSNCSQDGVCFGIAAMRMQAILAEDTALFDKRIKIIHDIPLENFKETIENLNRKRLEIILQVKRENAPFRELDDEEKNCLLSDKSLQTTLSSIEPIVMQFIQENKIPADSKEQEICRREKLCYFDALIQFKIQQKIAELPEEEQIGLDILPFFNGVQLYQRDHLYSYLQENKAAKSNDSHNILDNFSLVASVYFENQGGICELNQFSNVYTVDELIQLFSSFSEIASQTTASGGLAFVLRSVNHAITVGYHTDKNEWSLTDANHLPSAYSDDPAVIAKEVHQALSENSSAIFSTIIFSGKNSKNDWEEVLAQWNEDEGIKQIHCISPIKTLKKDSFDMSLLSLAAARGDVKLIQDIFEAEKFIPVEKRQRDVECPALVIATQNEHFEVLELLLNKGEDPNCCQRSDRATPLMRAVGSADRDVVKLLLEHGASVNEKTKKGHTALHLSALINDPVITQMLIDNGANCQSASEDGTTPLFLAVLYNNVEMVNVLIENDAEIDTPKYSNAELLLETAKKHDMHPQMVRFIEKKLQEPKPSFTLEIMLHLMNQDIKGPYIAISPKELAAVRGIALEVFFTTPKL